MSSPNSEPQLDNTQMSTPTPSPPPETTDSTHQPLTQPHRTPLPKKKLIVVFTMLFCDVLALTGIAPYINAMTADLLGLDEGKEKTKVGYYAGIIASSYYVAQFFCSFVWGWLSDRYGRRPIILAGIIGSIITNIGFGFSKYFWMAILFRSLYGLANGNIGVYKTYLGEITDSTNQAHAFAFIGLTFGLGIMIGPAMGGFLVQPAKWLPQIFGKGLFEMFPYLLPNLIVAGILLFGLAMGYFFLTETNQRVMKKETNNDIELETQTEEKVLENTDSSTVEVQPPKKKRFWETEIYQTRAPILTCTTYAICGLIQVAMDEMIPLFCWTPISDNGLGIAPWEIGLVSFVGGLFIFLYQLGAGAWINNKLGSRRAFRIGLLIGVPATALTAELRFVAHIQWLMWILLIILVMLRMLSTQMYFTAVMIMINNSVSFENMGQVNGLGQSLVAFCRAIGPASASALFAFSISHSNPLKFYPFDVHFPFYLVALGHVLNVLLSLLLPKDVDVPKEQNSELSMGLMV